VSQSYYSKTITKCKPQFLYMRKDYNTRWAFSDCRSADGRRKWGGRAVLWLLAWTFEVWAHGLLIRRSLVQVQQGEPKERLLILRLAVFFCLFSEHYLIISSRKYWDLFLSFWAPFGRQKHISCHSRTPTGRHGDQCIGNWDHFPGNSGSEGKSMGNCRRVLWLGYCG
jgi:hypothetical protein